MEAEHSEEIDDDMNYNDVNLDTSKSNILDISIKVRVDCLQCLKVLQLNDQS